MVKVEGLAIALVEPEYEVNLGHVARVMKNFGVQQLYLINPKANIGEAKRFASHGADVLEEAHACELRTLAERFDLLVGTTAIPGRRPSNLLRSIVTPESLAESLAAFTGKVCLLFGRDTVGLRNEELKLCDLIVHIPTGTDYRTLNVAHSVAILLYELSRERQAKEPLTFATREERERLVGYALKLARTSGLREHKAPLLERALKHVLSRSAATKREVSLLMGLLRKAASALERRRRYD